MSYPPYAHALLDRHGRVTKPWHLFFLSLVGRGADIGTAIPPGTITLDQLAPIASPRLLGRGSAGTGPVEAITLGDGLAMSGTELSVDATAVASDGYWTMLTNGDPVSPELVFASDGACIAVFVPTP